MASTSASSIQKSFKYDVFLSFRGEDTRKNFVDHLYHALQRKSIITYRDDEEIKKGRRIGDGLMRSIEDSKFYIIVFSKNYASSSWCLDELVKIMECQKTKEQTAYPVFYDVEPTEVRKQSGAVGEAFAKHEEKEGAGKWRDALREAADLAGWELKNTFDGHEAKFIEKIVEKISLDLSFTKLRIDEKLVGMEARVKYVVSSLEIDSDDVRMIGIKGMGGAGKTTLAKAVFDHISFRFEGSSFVENVKETSRNPLCGLKSLQKQILSDVLNDTNITVNGVSDLKNEIKKRMSGIKVLVVLDDVDHIEQLEALAGELKWFKPGSRVIITTREEQVLVAHGLPKNLILDVSLLSGEEANCLFNRYAFRGVTPNQGYENLSGQVVRYAAGLPLTIKVLGSFLCGKDESEWIDALDRLKRIPLKETLEKLELSYSGLEDDYKEIFLNVACILKGWNKEEAIVALESCGFHARSGLRVLQQKSLLSTVSSTWGESLYLDMHDHIEEMGKNIVRRLHPDEPSKHTRLWIEEEVHDILVEDKGNEATRCIKVQQVDPFIILKGLRKMKELRFLHIISDFGLLHVYQKILYDIFSDSLYLPNSLRYLRWDGYPFTCLPKNFQANNLVGLKMQHSRIVQLWGAGKKKELKKLRFIDLIYCKLRTLDIGLVPNLEMLKLQFCDKIKTINLEGQIPNLKSLELLGCYDLLELYMPIECIKLETINICFSKLKILNLSGTRNLKSLKLLECEELLELHMPIECIKLETINIHNSKLRTLNLPGTRFLRSLNFTHCEDLQELFMPIESPELRTIYICRSKLITLNLSGTRNLERLNLELCEDLQELRMPDESLSLKSINIRSSKLVTLNLFRTRNLKMLDLELCEDLQELRMPDESPELKTINIRRSKLITLNLSGTRNLERLDLELCEDLQELRMPDESLSLKSINIRSSKLITLNLFRTRNLEMLDLDESLSLKSINIRSSKLITLHLFRTRNLEVLDLELCEDLLELRMPDESLSLKSINIRSSKLITLDLSGTRNLERLDLEHCWDLQELRMPDESLSLKSINIRSSKLMTLNLSRTRNLERLDLILCEDLQELRMPDESLSLKSINIDSSKLITLNLFGARNLERLDPHRCFTSEEISVPVGCLSGSVRFRPFWVNQGSCMVGSLAELHLKARPFGICPMHPDDNLPKFHFECTYRELMPLSTRNLEKLISFSPCACKNVVSLSGGICGLQSLRKLTLEGGLPEVPKEIEELECLEKLILLSTNIEYLPDSICMLKHLKVLHLKSCWLLKHVPKDLGRLSCLEELRLTECKSLRDIPNSICEMKCLKLFHLTNCISVGKLPKEIGRLTCLKELKIEGAPIIDLPESLFQLEDLRIFP